MPGTGKEAFWTSHSVKVNSYLAHINANGGKFLLVVGSRLRTVIRHEDELFAFSWVSPIYQEFLCFIAEPLFFNSPIVSATPAKVWSPDHTTPILQTISHCNCDWLW